MKRHTIFWLIGAAAIAILGLIAIQVVWMQHSRNLLEEQFNNRVNMALCSAVERVAANPVQSDEVRACCAAPNAVCEDGTDLIRDQPEMASALSEALRFYQIDLPYRMALVSRDSVADAAAPRYSCSLVPVLEDDTHVLQLEFEGKAEYFLEQMGLMITASVSILIFICIIFGLATYYLLRQKRMSDQNRDFFNHMTHEFRTPLTNIRLAGNLLVRKNPALAGNQYLDIIRHECNQLSHQVENVLHLGGLEKGKYQLKSEPVNLRQLTDEVVAGMELQIRESAGVVEVEPVPDDLVITGDAFHLGNAFRNLLDNALKYSGTEPRVQIGFQAAPDGCQVSFTDNGAGLSDKDRQKIFRKFHRCESALRSGKKGFGLGLAYVKKIVELHRGQIAVSSPNGKGARFDLFFPNTK
ncbi:MAG: HAMP domain-containing histidine kinase [Bacteroidetes bacterium]|nr:MAG: HAMP domain-containing histidine kinase [Bacteroidota bacterium]